MEPKRATFKIVIKRVERPFASDPWQEFDWICQSLGFFEPIDRDKTASTIFREVFQSAEKGRALTSSEICDKVQMSRGSVINHLSNLMRSGLIVRDGRFYLPRSKSVLRTIEELEEDIERVFSRMKKTAREIDEELGVAEDKGLCRNDL